MQRSWNGVLRGIALLVLLAVVGLPSAFADDPSNPFDPPEARILPPGGIASEARIGPPGGIASEARIRPVGGIASEARIGPPSGSESRIKPPGGVTASQPSWFELLMAWLR